MKTAIEKSFIEFISKDKKSLHAAKCFATDNKQYELAVQIRALEKELFPVNEKHQEKIDRADDVDRVLRMCDIHLRHKKHAYIIDHAISALNTFKGKFDLKMASKIVSDAEDIFD